MIVLLVRSEPVARQLPDAPAAAFVADLAHHLIGSVVDADTAVFESTAWPGGFGGDCSAHADSSVRAHIVGYIASPCKRYLLRRYTDLD